MISYKNDSSSQDDEYLDSMVSLGSDLFKRYVELLLVIFGGLCLLIPSGYSIGYALLMLTGLYALIRYYTELRSEVDRQTQLILLAMALYGGVLAIVNGVLHGFHSDIDKMIRIMLAIPIFYAVVKARPSLQALWLGCALGAIGAFGLIVYSRFVLLLTETTLYHNRIQYGNIALLLGLFSGVGVFWLLTVWRSLSLTKRSRVTQLIVYLLGLLAGLLASALSNARGGWLALPFVGLLLLFSYRRFFSQKSLTVVFLLGTALALGVYNHPATGVKDRVDLVSNDIRLYQTGEVNTSIGIRFEMWRGAMTAFYERPLLGWGEKGYRQRMADYADSGRLHPRVATFEHAHNELIDHLAKRGVFGFLILLALYTVPCLVFARALFGACRDNPNVRAIATAGIILCLSYFIFGWTQAFLRHNSGVMVFAGYLAVLAGYLRVNR